MPNCDELRMSISGRSSDSLRDELCLRLAENQLKASQGYQSLRSDTELAQTNNFRSTAKPPRTNINALVYVLSTATVGI